MGRYDRSMRLFGAEGQARLRKTAVVVAGVGGLGSALVQQFALLGVARITTIEPQELDETNRNRFVGARATDPIPGSYKVLLADRLIRETNPDVESVPLLCDVISPDGFDAVKKADWVCGCFDDDGPRSIVNELCAAYDIPYIDLASDVPTPGVYGGRVCVSRSGNGCLACLGLLDRKAVRRYLETDEAREAEDQQYGIPLGALNEVGPSVSPVNGVVAALAATEFMVAVTGLREPVRLQEYRAWQSKVVVVQDLPASDCLVCKGVRGTGRAADVERFLRLAKFNSARLAP